MFTLLKSWWYKWRLRNPITRSRAAYALARLGNRTAIKLLLRQSINDSHDGAVKTLDKEFPGWEQSKEAWKLVPELIKGLRHYDLHSWGIAENLNRQEKAALRLGRIGDRGDVVKHLIWRLESRGLGQYNDSYVLSAAAYSLGNIGDAKAIKPLVEALISPGVRKAALESLAKIDPNWRQSGETIAAVCNTIRGTFLTVKNRHKPGPYYVGYTDSYYLREEAPEVASMGSAIVPGVILHLNHRDKEMRHFALDVLENINEPWDEMLLPETLDYDDRGMELSLNALRSRLRQ